MAKAFTLVGGLGGGAEWTGSYTITPTTSNIVIPEDTVFNETFTVLGDVDLLPKNIKNGIDIFNIQGTADPVQDVGGLGTVYITNVSGTNIYRITNINYN